MASESNSSSSSGKSSRPALGRASLPEIEKVFNRFDANNDGLISSSELSAVLSALGSGSSPTELDRMMEEMDSDKDGFINLHEFADFCSRKVEGDESGMKELHDAFQLYDEDKNGLISASELHKVLTQLGERCTVEDCGKMIQSVDSDGDGNVSFEEFKKMMSTKSNS